MPTLLLTRPEGLNDKAAARAQAMGFKTIKASLMAIEPVAHQIPDGPFDALLLTSVQAMPAANAAGDNIKALPVYTVGPATARAARAAGLQVVAEGKTDGRAIVRTAHKQGVRRLLHLRGVHGAELDPPAELQITTIPVYRARLAETLPSDIRLALQQVDGLIVTLFSPRAATCFAGLVNNANAPRHRLSLVVISEAAEKAAGTGWKAIRIAAAPTTNAMLAAANQLWQEQG